MGLRQAEYEGKKGWYDDQSQEFLPGDVWRYGEYEGRKGVINSGNQEFVPLDSGSQSSIQTPATSGLSRWLGTWDDWKRGASGAIEEAAPIVGAIGGGIAGAPTGPAGAAAGAALGYAGGRQLSNYVASRDGRRRWQGLGPEATEMGKDLITGAGTEAGGALIGKAINNIGIRLAPHAEGMYRRALKIPNAAAYKRLFPGAEATAAETMVREGIEYHIVPNKTGMREARAMAENLADTTRTVVDEFTKANPKTNVGIYDLERQGMTDTMARANRSGEFESAKEAVGTVRDSLRRMSGPLNASELEALKQQFYREVRDWEKSNPIFNVKGQFTNEAKKEISLKAMEILERWIPETKYWNKKWGAWMDLQKAIEDTIHLEGGKNMVGIGGKILSVRNYGLAALDAALGIPSVKAKLAFWLAKGADWQAKNMSRIVALKAAEDARENPTPESTSQVIKYDQNGMRLTR